MKSSIWFWHQYKQGIVTTWKILQFELGLEYFDHTMNDVLSNTLELYPSKALEMNLDAATIDYLGSIPFFLVH